MKINLLKDLKNKLVKYSTDISQKLHKIFANNHIWGIF